MRAVKLLALSLFLLLLALFFFPRKKDKESYLTLLSESEGKKEESSSVKQERKGVVKEIWFNGKYLLIEAPKAELFWVEKKEAIEELHGVKAKALEPMGDKMLLRTFSSENGRFFYRNLSFLGQEVHFSSYTLAGTGCGLDIPDSTPDMAGIAEELLLQLKEEQVAFQAKKIKLNVEKGEGL